MNFMEKSAILSDWTPLVTGLIKIPAVFVPYSDKENRPWALPFSPKFRKSWFEIKWNGPSLFVPTGIFSGTQRRFSENTCSEDDLRSGIFGTFVAKFIACLPLLGFSKI